MGNEAGEIHWVAIALGSNLGDSYKTLNSALQSLDTIPEIKVQSISPVYQTVAIGPPQPDILNACALLTTTLTPRALLETLLQTEVKFGRVRRERWGSRSLDLDLLLFDDLILKQPGLQIPHPGLTERAFVLVPLANIAPNWIEPVSGQTIVNLLQQVDCSGVKNIVLE